MCTKIPNLYQNILKKFPQRFTFCFAYGSSVKKQLGYDYVDIGATGTQTYQPNKKLPPPKDNKLIDFIFTVDNPYEWHCENMRQNSHHYSGMRFLGSNIVSKYQDNFGAGVYFNTLIKVPEENVMIKYGVISTQILLEDLRDWNHLHLAGRLHKPVEIIHEPVPEISAGLKLNMKSAVHTALLLLPEFFTDFDLFMTIARFSYDGDFRMIFGEKKNKVRNIVEPQLADFYRFYQTIFSEHFNDYLTILPSNTLKHLKKFQQIHTDEAKYHHLQNLPAHLKFHIIKNTKYKRKDVFDLNESLEYLSRNHGVMEQVIRKSLKSIVWSSSCWQSIKNIPSAGVTKTIIYSYDKALKTFK